MQNERITIQMIFDELRYNTLAQVACGILAVLLFSLWLSAPGSGAVTYPKEQISWDMAGRSMNSCQIKAQGIESKYRADYIIACMEKSK